MKETGNGICLFRIWASKIKFESFQNTIIIKVEKGENKIIFGNNHTLITCKSSNPVRKENTPKQSIIFLT